MYKKLFLFLTVLVVAMVAGTARAELLAHWRFDTVNGTLSPETVNGYDCNLIGSAFIDTANKAIGAGSFSDMNVSPRSIIKSGFSEAMF